MAVSQSATSKKTATLKVAGLFAGIGGIELGFHRAGHQTSLLCEIDPAALAVLSERFGEVPIHEDVTTLRSLGDVDVVTAGFPCQDLSQAGQTRGLKGDKSSLVAHVFRLLRREPVEWVVLENVPFMLQLAKGHALEFVVEEFERLGYKWAYRVIDTRAFGLPHRRERVFFVASRSHDPRPVLFEGDHAPQGVDASKVRANGFYWTEGSRGLGWAEEAVPTLKGGSTVGIPSPPAIWLSSGEIVQPDIRDAERLQGFPAGWTSPAEDVVRSGNRWRLVGNAVTVDVAEWVGSRLGKTSSRTWEGQDVRTGRAWPRVAWNVDGRRQTTALSTWPVERKRTPLSEFLKYPTKPLSWRATFGFLSRFRNSTLSKPDGFVEALEAHLSSMESVAAIRPDRAEPRAAVR